MSRDYKDIWDELNRDGFAACDCDDPCDCDINELGDFGALIQRAETMDDLAVYREDSLSIVIVGDAWGPWAVRVEDEEVTS